MTPSEASTLLVRKLNGVARLSGEDRQALKALPITLRLLESDANIVLEGDQPTKCCVILDGWAARHKSADDGQRQILSLHPPGDFVDFQSLFVPRMDHTITTLMPTTVGVVAHADMRRILAQSPTFAQMLWQAVFIETALTRQWLLNVGQRDAQARIAHLLCETFTRLHALGMAHEIGPHRTFSWPMTQQRLGEAVGMSSVHVNRSLQELRALNLLQVNLRQVTILDWAGLVAKAGFDAAYLNLPGR